LYYLVLFVRTHIYLTIVIFVYRKLTFTVDGFYVVFSAVYAAYTWFALFN